MKTATFGLATFLNSSQQYFMADLITITLVDTTVLRYAVYDMDIVYNGHTFNSKASLFERSRVRTVLGVEVDTLDLKVWPKSGDTISGTSWPAAVASGSLDGATVLLERVFMSAPGVVYGGFVNFSGTVAEIAMTRTEIQVTVKSDLQLLNVQMPRNLYQPGCQHTLYDADCGVSRSSFMASGTVTSGATRTQIPCGLTQTFGWFASGYLVFTGGTFTGTKRTVKAYSPGQVLLLNPLPAAPSAGDTFSIYPGCDKSQQTCTAKFNNVANFRGFPYIPIPETSR
jgi:uncharacterized phage protein (TIGR02218 family)